MKRYTPLLLLAFAVVFLAAAGSVWLTGHADRTGLERKPAVTVYTTLPAEQAGLLAASYEELTRARVDFIPLTPDELTERLRVEGKKPGSCGRARRKARLFLIFRSRQTRFPRRLKTKKGPG